MIRDDILSDVLRAVRISGSLQFCLAASGNWQTDGTPRLGRTAGAASNVVPFHIVAQGRCWLKIGEAETDLEEGDIVAFPFATGHQLGVGRGGALIIPTEDLPPKPWSDIPLLRYGRDDAQLRLLCGYVTLDALNFHPLRHALPNLIHVRTKSRQDGGWLNMCVRQMIEEADRHNSGGVSMIERLTEVILIALLRHQMLSQDHERAGWFAGMTDPQLGKCLAALHAAPERHWTVPKLAELSGLSRSALMERFQDILQTSPMRYVRDWRLYLASTALVGSNKSIARIAEEAGYGTEAAFNRAFAKTYGVPPARWRANAKSIRA